MRKNSFAIQGGSFGDEGKGKVVDELCSRLVEKHKKILVYRWNGGANAGHTVVLNGKKTVLHHIPSGALIKGAMCILGKGMVLHPGDLIKEIIEIKKTRKSKVPAKLVIDEMSVLTLDTHRAFEAVLKDWAEGGSGSTGRGIAPAYSDVILRHPVRMRDLVGKTWKKKLSKHYDLYRALVEGLGEKISAKQVPNLKNQFSKVGSKNAFLQKLENQRKLLKKYVVDANMLVRAFWNSKVPFVFEGAQGVGLDPRWGVYPDVTSSDPTFSGIAHSTEGVVHPDEIEVKASVFKATYMSSVGKRKLPTKMNTKLANKIRKDANEYGATTGRPRDIYYVDLPALKFFSKVTKPTHLVLTHLDISYEDYPVKVCTNYIDLKGKKVFYRPDQEFLNKTKPKYKEFKPWDGKLIRGVNNTSGLPKQVKTYVDLLAKTLELKPWKLTTGPERNAVVTLNF
ncbi:MAG: adenylosuccinate synthetase [Patescibacteria group bacterium]